MLRPASVYIHNVGNPDLTDISVDDIGPEHDITDELSAETADKVFHEVMNHIDKDFIVKLLDIIKESSEERVMMIWMRESYAKTVITELGMSGALNSDPQNPELCVFYNFNLSCKLGPYVNYQVSYGEGVENEDCSVSYPATVVLSNTIGEETIKRGNNNSYILSLESGADFDNSMIYLFAPAGGKVSNFENDGNVDIQIEEYNGLQLGFSPYFVIYPGETITFTYTATTAPGVTVRPAIVTQPLIHDYCV